MAFKGKTVSGTPSPHIKVSNSAGFNKSAGQLGDDSQPGPGPGAPLMNSRTVDDGPTKR
jgi:hypothetical protein